MARTYRLTPHGLQRKRARMKALNADPTFKAKTSVRMKALNADPTFKAKTSVRMKALHADPTFKAKLSKAASARMKALRSANLIEREGDQYRLTAFLREAR